VELSRIVYVVSHVILMQSRLMGAVCYGADQYGYKY